MDYLTTRTSLSPIWRGFVPGFVNYKKGVLDSQVIKFTSCLPMVGGSLRLLPPLKLVVMILLKVALNIKKNQKSFNPDPNLSKTTSLTCYLLLIPIIRKIVISKRCDLISLVLFFVRTLGGQTCLV